VTESVSHLLELDFAAALDAQRELGGVMVEEAEAGFDWERADDSRARSADREEHVLLHHHAHRVEDGRGCCC